jgi:hypothetical protein
MAQKQVRLHVDTVKELEKTGKSFGGTTINETAMLLVEKHRTCEARIASLVSENKILKTLLGVDDELPIEKVVKMKQKNQRRAISKYKKEEITPEVKPGQLPLPKGRGL